MIVTIMNFTRRVSSMVQELHPVHRVQKLMVRTSGKLFEEADVHEKYQQFTVQKCKLIIPALALHSKINIVPAEITRTYIPGDGNLCLE